MKNMFCWRNEEINPQYPIELSQQGIDRFTVRYGRQIQAHLNYGQAAANLGQAIMHALACEGKLDNREKGER